MRLGQTCLFLTGLGTFGGVGGRELAATSRSGMLFATARSRLAMPLVNPPSRPRKQMLCKPLRLASSRALSTLRDLPLVVNAPLDFELQGLDAAHPYLSGRGFVKHRPQRAHLTIRNRKPLLRASYASSSGVKRALAQQGQAHSSQAMTGASV